MRSLLLMLLIKTTFAYGIDWNGRTIANGCDFPGNDLKYVKEADPKQCASHCFSTKECTHYTWTNFDGGTCWLKKGPVTKSDASSEENEGAVCGVEWDTHGIEWNGNKWAHWCDFYGNDLANATTKSKNCYNRCAATKDCTHFTWTNYNGGTCWMKKGSILRQDAFPKYDENAVCGITDETHKIDWRYWDGYTWANECYFHGNFKLKTVTIPSWRKCVALCVSTQGCTHLNFHYHNETCTLRNGTVGKSDAKSSQAKHDRCAIFRTYPVVLSGRSTRYWDCCKPKCAAINPVASCAADGETVHTNSYTPSGCDGGTAYICNNNIPWAINDTVSFGFAAAHIINQTEADLCCKCFHLTFTSPKVKGKKMIVQVTNPGKSGWDWENRFALQIPGGGVEANVNGCSSQWDTSKGWGARYGGVVDVKKCDKLPEQIRQGCKWRWDWFNGADNPRFNFFEIKCPKEIISKTGCVRS